MNHDVIVVGAGIFGVTAAVELQRRGHRTVLLDAGPIPHPLAASTDISKVVRMEYGDDEQYMEMMEASMPGWRQWNLDFGETLFHETGMSILSRTPMTPGGFEFESFALLQKRGHEPERLDADAVAHRFPAWAHGSHVDGFYNKSGGFAESGRVVEVLTSLARDLGVDVRPESAAESVQTANGQVTGVVCRDGARVAGDQVVVAAGAWTPALVPELAAVTRITGHPVFHLETDKPDLFRMGTFATFMADVSNTGWYGFPLHPLENVVKIANHGIGIRLTTDDERVVTQEDEHELRRFLRSTFPALSEAPIVYTRRCLYCDTLDGHLWIAPHPEIRGLTVATGGSGHGFKFAPILGELIADAVEDRPHPWLNKFRWRSLGRYATGEEATRRRA
jgi:glycine/D-amino acid oxidase-like deaminating enzyme